MTVCFLLQKGVVLFWLLSHGRFIPEIQALLEKDARLNNTPRSLSSLHQEEMPADSSPNSRRQWKVL